MFVTLRSQNSFEDCQPVVGRLIAEIDCIGVLLDKLRQLAK